MCGRYAITSPPEAIRALFGYEERPNFPARYNVAPTQPIPIVRLVDGRRRFALVRWGLIPHWVKDPKAFSLMIHARGDSVADKPAFRAAVRRRRCLIPADGFYEWKEGGPVSRPHFIRRKDGAPFALAGLWETWTGPNGEEVETAALITTEANDDLTPVHHRMPVIIPPEDYERWLACDTVTAEEAASLITAAPNGVLEWWPILTAVNRVANDSAALIEPVAPDAAAEETRPAARRRPRKDDRQASLF